MSRRTVLASLIGAVLVGGMAGPALADPILPPVGNGKDTTVCVLTQPSGGDREGICVWVPYGR